MALLDLLRDPTAFATVNPNDPKASFAKGPGGPSKGITYIPNTVSFQFNQRVSIILPTVVDFYLDNQLCNY